MPTQAKLADEFGIERGAVRQALRILQEEGLLTHVSKGSPARVAESPARVRSGRTAEPQPTMVSLAPRIAGAFTAEHVAIDAVCLTSRSLLLAMGEPLRLIHKGELKPATIDVRVLLPSRDITLAFPAPVDTSTDVRVHQRWLAQRNAQGQVLRHNLQSLRSTHHIDVRVSFRALPFTPPVKLYLLNDDEALIAYYMLTRREEAWGTSTLDMYDVLGTSSLLFSFEAAAGPRDAAFVEQSRQWFDALWETITTDLTLS